MIDEIKDSEEILVGFRRAISEAGEAIFITDKEGVISYINQGFTNIYGYTYYEVVGKVTPRIIKSGLTSADDVKNFWNALLHGEKLGGEHKNKRKDGVIVDIEGSASAIFDEKKNIIGFLAIQRDITGRKNAEAQLKEKVEELEKMNKIMVGRELKMVELKKENEELRKKMATLA